jgi:flagellar hook-associated protein 2
MATTVGTLDSSYISMINDIMSVEQQPLTRLQTSRDTITAQKNVYSDLSTLLNSFQSSAKALHSTDALYTLSAGRTTKLTGMATGLTVATATADSTAVTGAYQFSVTTLAKESRIRSDRQASYNTALGQEGTIILGSTGKASTFSANTVTGFSTIAAATGQVELGAEQYSVETRNDATNGWQFRLVNSIGNAISIKQADGKYASTWQSITPGEVDTGRGLQITFGSDSGQYLETARGTGAAQMDYVGRNMQIDIVKTDTLVDIARKINKANTSDGNGVTASIIDNQLVLANKRSGKDYTMTTSDSVGTVLLNLGLFKVANVMQTADDAVMKVNGLTVTRSKNTGLKDVIGGMTLNLAADAEGQSATIGVTADSASDKTAFNTFVTNYNKVIDYLSAKVATTKQADGTYTRGALAGDSMFSSLRQDLVRKFNASFTNSGSFRRMSDLGLTVDTNFHITISDSTKLEKALNDDRTNATSLLDQVMTSVESTLGRYTSTSGYMTSVSKAADRNLTDTKAQITTMTARLTARQQALYTQFANAQSAIMAMTYQSQQIAAMFSATG